MKIKMKAIFMAMGLLLPVANLFAQNKNTPIDSIMQVFNAANKFTGSALVVHEGEVVYRHGLGLANQERRLPNSPNTIFYIGSLTKPFTAVLTLQLVQTGSLTLASTLGTFFPGLKTEALRKVTIHQLLSHTSGIPDFIQAGQVTAQKITDEWLTQKLNSLTLEAAPGFKYASSTYVLLAHITEKVTGQPYATVLQKNILDKCGMKESGSVVTGQKLKNVAQGYAKQGEEPAPVTAFDPAIFKGAGSMYATANDLFRFDQALYTNQLLSDTYRNLLFTTTGSYGYGWFIRQIPGLGKVTFHEGSIPGYTSLFFRVVDKKISIILLSNNQTNEPHKQQLARSILGILNSK